MENGLYNTQGTFRGESDVLWIHQCTATFQAMMNEILKDLIQGGRVKVYLDVILIFTMTIEENLKLTKIVLRRLEENDLFAKPEKCFFFKEEIEYLGTIISHGVIKMDPAKVAGVLDWPTPV